MILTVVGEVVVAEMVVRDGVVITGGVMIFGVWHCTVAPPFTPVQDHFDSVAVSPTSE